MGRRKNSGKSVGVIPTQFDKSEELEKLGKELIANYHPDLINTEIAYLFCNKEFTKGGRKVIATVKKVGLDVKALCGYEFIISVYYKGWNLLDEKLKHYILDHEMEHIHVDTDDKTGEEKKSLIDHDFSEFNTILYRYGLVSEDLRKLGIVMEDVLNKEKAGTTEE